MTISKRQFNLLNAMEIPLWVAKRSSAAPEIKEAQEVESTEIVEKTETTLKNIAQIELPLLSNNQLFKDILLTLGLSPVDISIESNILNLGLISWQFSLQNTLNFENNCLISPTIEQLEQSTTLKRQLWQLIIDKELICQ